MKKAHLLTLILFFSFSTVLPAQFGALKDKLKAKIENSGNDKDSEKKKKKKKDRKPLFNLEQMLGSSDMELEESYDYQFRVDWVIYSDDKEEPTKMGQLLSENDMTMAMEFEDISEDVQQGTMVIDFKRSYMLLLSTEEQRAVVTAFEDIEAQIQQDTTEEDMMMKLTKTGETKDIIGYSCEKYLFETDDTEGEMWVTKDLQYANYNLFSFIEQLSKKRNRSMGNDWDEIKDGFALEIKSVEKEKGGSTSHMVAQGIDKAANVSYKMSDYQVIDLTGLPKGMGY